jgi:hypothetical protein
MARPKKPQPNELVMKALKTAREFAEKYYDTYNRPIAFKVVMPRLYRSCKTDEQKAVFKEFLDGGTFVRIELSGAGSQFVFPGTSYRKEIDFDTMADQLNKCDAMIKQQKMQAKEDAKMRQMNQARARLEGADDA